MEGSQASLPVELLIQIIKYVATQPGPQRQHDLARLRLTSKQLSQLSTSHFYEIIELSNYADTLNLVRQLQSQPQLQKTTRAVWWDVEPAERLEVESEEQQLLVLPNVDEVAFCFTQECKTSKKKKPTRFPIGIHYSLRDAGSWCESLPFLRPSGLISNMQGTPTLEVEWENGDKHGIDWAAVERDREKVSEWHKSNPGQPPPEGEKFPWRITAQPRRAIWAAHLTIPAFREELDLWDLWEAPGTITHLTITLYSHTKLDNEDSYEPFLRRVLDPRRMPCLEYFDVIVSSIGEGKEGLYCAFGIEDGEDEDRDALDLDRGEELQIRMDSFIDVRTFVDELYEPRTEQRTLSKDVRNYVLHQWQERVYRGNTGPWKDPQTHFLRPQVVSGWFNEDEMDVYHNPYVFAPDADFKCNRPDEGYVERQLAVRRLRSVQLEKMKACVRRARQDALIDVD